MHLDSLGSSICIWVRDDETHTQLRIGQNTDVRAKTHSYADVFWPIPECVCVRTYAYEFETHLGRYTYIDTTFQSCRSTQDTRRKVMHRHNTSNKRHQYHNSTQYNIINNDNKNNKMSASSTIINNKKSPSTPLRQTYFASPAEANVANRTVLPGILHG